MGSSLTNWSVEGLDHVEQKAQSRAVCKAIAQQGRWMWSVDGYVIEGVLTDTSGILKSVGLNCSLLALHVPETDSRFSPLFVCCGFD